MVDYILEISDVNRPTEKGLLYDEIFNYANFLNKSLELGMFIPCDLKSNILDKPDGYDNYVEFGMNDLMNENECKKYQEAKKRVVFKNAEWNNYYELIIIGSTQIDLILGHEKTIQDLVGLGLEIK